MFPGVRVSAARRSAFTLVELLIVIAIIAILTTLIAAGVNTAMKERARTEAVTTLSNFKQALEQYRMEEGKLPAFGLKSDPERNDFPKLYAALMEKPPVGGRSSPYLELRKEKIMVMDDGVPVPATAEDLKDPKIEKYYLDPWDKPYVYRCNQGLREEPWMVRPRSYDFYSRGPNGKDDTAEEAPEDENDDIFLE